MSILSDITDLSSLAQHLFPNGKLVRGGTELRAGDVNGSPGSSLSIKLESGIWIDHNGGEGGDLVDVLCHRFHLDYRGAAEWLRVNGWLNRPSRQYAPAPVPRPTPAEPEPLPCAPSGQPLPYKLAERFARSQRWQLLDDGLHLHPYAWPDGQIPVVVARYQLAQGGKQVRRLGWGGKSKQWRVGGTAGLHPLPPYNILRLNQHPEAFVLLVEGERAADAVERLFSNYVGVTVLGGSNPAAGTDWTLLHGRVVHVLPDADPAGGQWCVRVTAELRAVGIEPRLLVPQEVYAYLGGRGKCPRGWDIADPLPPRPTPVDPAPESAAVPQEPATPPPDIHTPLPEGAIPLGATDHMSADQVDELLQYLTGAG